MTGKPKAKTWKLAHLCMEIRSTHARGVNGRSEEVKTLKERSENGDWRKGKHIYLACF